nr:ABC transporter ATP-binding protein [uncultured Roseococcus sp.]
MSAVRIRGVGKRYTTATGETVTGLSPVSLSIEPGSFISIVGRSGCGKSTLLRLVAGLEQPTAGAVEIDGAPVAAPPDSVRYVFQNYAESLLPWKTVRENIRFGLRHAYALEGREADPRRWDAVIEEKLAEVGLHGISGRYPAELSGGMQQRVAIARALASRPRILLLDEPFSAVDALSRAKLQDLLLDVWRSHGLTILFVTHDIDEALYLSDRVIVLAPGGKGIEEDAPVTLSRPRDQIETRAHETYLNLRGEILHRVLQEGAPA